MKHAILAGVALACLTLSACASGPGTQTVSVTIDAATADAAAIKFEKAVGVFADTLAVAASDPNSGLDLTQLASDVGTAKGYLAQGRAAFDARTGGVVDSATKALDAISLGLPATASPKVRGALLTARLAVGLYGANIGATAGAGVPPSDELVTARKSADVSIASLVKILPPPGAT